MLLVAALESVVLATTVARPLSVTDAIATDGTITVQTPDWKLVYSTAFNGGIHQWFDLAADPAETDSLAGAFFGTFPYSQGALFGYQAYLSTSPAMEFMTTVGINADPGSLQLSILENTPARVRIRQQSQPRLNNGLGPLTDPFPEMGLITATTDWTIYPTGKVHIDFTTAVASGGVVIDSGPGGAGHGVDVTGASQLTASGGVDFQVEGILVGDTIESGAGGWGPRRIVARPTSTQLALDAAVPPGTDLDYVVRRTEIDGETISIHGDGDPLGGCTIHPWQAGSNGKPLWEDQPLPALVPDVPGQFLLAQWGTGERAAGSLLTFFEQPWPDANFAAFDSCFYVDISYTQIGRMFVRHTPAERHLHLLAHMGSAATCGLPTIKSVADALPFGVDYRAPWAEALVGSLETGPEIAAAGFDPGTGTYGVTATSVPASTCGGTGPPCYEAVIRFDTQGGGRGGFEYRTPAVLVGGFPVPDDTVGVEISTDGGASFSPLAWRQFNLTSETDESELGAGRRLFQYLGDVPASATGANAVAFRFLGPLATPPPAPTGATCPATPVTGCRAPGKSIVVLKNLGGDQNKLSWRWLQGDAPVGGFGDPRGCSHQSLCVYDAVASSPTVALDARLLGGGTCRGIPCWKATGNPPTGFKYRDPDLQQAGILKIVLKGGQPGADKITVKGKGASLPFPAPAGGTFLHQEGDVIVQLVTDDGECWESVFPPGTVLENRPDLYKARSDG